MEENGDFFVINFETESGKIFRVPILRDADEINFYPQTSEPQRDVFCLMTRRFVEGSQILLPASARCALCAESHIPRGFDQHLRRMFG